jgi:hypothetical protein
MMMGPGLWMFTSSHIPPLLLGFYGLFYTFHRLPYPFQIDIPEHTYWTRTTLKAKLILELVQMSK